MNSVALLIVLYSSVAVVANGQFLDTRPWHPLLQKVVDKNGNTVYDRKNLDAQKNHVATASLHITGPLEKQALMLPASFLELAEGPASDNVMCSCTLEGEVFENPLQEKPAIESNAMVAPLGGSLTNTLPAAENTQELARFQQAAGFIPMYKQQGQLNNIGYSSAFPGAIPAIPIAQWPVTSFMESGVRPHM